MFYRACSRAILINIMGYIFFAMLIFSSCTHIYYVINVILNSIFLSSNAELIPCKFDCAWPRHALLIVIIIKAIVLNLYLFLECFPFILTEAITHCLKTESVVP